VKLIRLLVDYSLLNGGDLLLSPASILLDEISQYFFTYNGGISRLSPHQIRSISFLRLDLSVVWNDRVLWLI